MATINISDLRPIGSDLFSDSEFINDLSEEELNIQGGLIIPFFSPRCAPISI